MSGTPPRFLPVLAARRVREGAHLRIHKAPCKHCPSAHGPGDPESDDMKTWPRADQLKTVFTCAWRPSALCKGWCDAIAVTEDQLLKEPWK